MKEASFLDFNTDNILMNLHQAEDHLRYLNTDVDAGFASCIMKHLLVSEGEANEAISHSNIVEPAKSGEFRELRNSIRGFRKTLEKRGIQKDNDIKEVRKLRRDAESLTEKYDTTKCKACGEISDFFEKIKKDLNSKTDKINTIVNQNKKMPRGVTMNELIEYNGGQVVGEILKEGSKLIGNAITPGKSTLYNATTWIDIVGGLAGQLYLQKANVDPTVRQMGMIGLSNMLVSKVKDVTMEQLSTTGAGLGLGTRRVATPTARMQTVRAAASNAYSTAGNGLVTLD